MEFLKYLNSPHLVVNFQKSFGVVPTQQFTDSETSSAAIHKNHDLKHNGVSNGKSFQNGIHSCEQNSHLHKRNGFTPVLNGNGHALNGNYKAVEAEQIEQNIKDKFNTDEYIITNKFFYYLFQFGASLGNEIFYITFYPFWIWNIDGFVGRRMCIFWALFMYLGQATKDILKIPRPSSPPVMRMEKLYALEYGMPSTHAMVGAGFPFTIVFLTWQRYIYPVQYGIMVALTWTVLVCCSRLYLGMHSILDVIAGLAYVFSLMPIYFLSMDYIDDFLVTHPLSPLVAIGIPLALCLCYPKLKRWSTARGDTTIIVSVASGVCVGMHLAYTLGIMQRAPYNPPYPIAPIDRYWPVLISIRLVIGVASLILTRQIMKFLMLKLIGVIMGIDTKNKENQKCFLVELPTKFVTYFSIAFVAVFVAPGIFRVFGVERDTYFTEM